MTDTQDNLDLFSKAFGIGQKMQAALLRVLWVLFVTGHIAWVCGWLDRFGFPAPFSRPADVGAAVDSERKIRVSDREALDGTVSDIRKNANAALNIIINRELREEMGAYCLAKADTQDAMRQYIDYLEGQYQTLHNRPYAEPACAQRRR